MHLHRSIEPEEGFRKLNTSGETAVHQSEMSATAQARPRLDEIAPLTAICGGVTFYSDRENEDCYLDVSIDHEPLALLMMLRIVAVYGLEPESDSEDTINEDGTIRTYLLEVSD